MTDLLTHKNIGPARASDLADQTMGKCIEVVNRAVTRGHFELSELEAIIAANLAMSLQAGDQHGVGQKIRLVRDQVQLLREIIKTREELKLQKEMAIRLEKIEADLAKD